MEILKYRHYGFSIDCDCDLCEGTQGEWYKKGTYYIAGDGCDFCTGTETRPFNTFQHAVFMSTNPGKFRKILKTFQLAFIRIKDIIKYG